MSVAAKTPYLVIVIEDEPAYRKMLLAELARDPRLRVVGEADTWETAQRLVDDTEFDLALIDLQLQGRLAHDLIGPASARAKVVVQSVYGDTNAVVASLAAGASGYLHKEAPDIDIAETLVGVMQGLVPISPTVAGHLLSMVRGQPNAEGTPDDKMDGWHLTGRELEVLEWLARGLTYKEVGERCDITFNTVAFHVKQIYEKLQVSSRSAAVYQALNQGLIRI